MVITKRKFFLTHARIILDDKNLEEYFREKKYSYITGLSYNRFDFGPDVSVKHKKTILVSLLQDPEQLFMGFNANTRNEVRRALDENCLNIVADDKNRGMVYDLYAAFERAQSRRPQDASIFLGSKVFNAYHNGDLISVVICYDAPPVLRSRANFSKRLDAEDKEKRRLISRATRLLIYEICLYGRAHGYKYFDQGSVNLIDPKKKSIGEFKGGFGGELVDEYSYEYRGLLARLAKMIGL